MAPIGVFYAIDAMARGGTELQLTGLIERLDRRILRPYLCTLGPLPEDLRPADCRCLELSVRSFARPHAWRELGRLVRYLRREKVGIVQTFFQDATVFAGLAAWLARVPVRLGSFRDLGFWRTRKQEYMMRRIFPLMHGFVANSEAVRSHFCTSDGLAPDRVHVIPNGLDLDAFPFVAHPETDISVGIVGNLNRRVKRTDLFLDAAGRLARRHPEVSWHIIGDGELRPRLERQAHDLGISQRTIFTGRLADVAGYLEKLAVGVICSDSEGFSNAVLEYMLRGCAVVATDVGGSREAIEHERTGLLVPAGDAGALAAAIARLIEQPDLRRDLAERARRVAESNYSWRKCVDAHSRLYGQYLQARGIDSVLRGLENGRHVAP